MIIQAVFQALLQLAQAGMVYMIYAFSKHAAALDKLAPYKLYLMALGGSLFLAMGSYANSGYSTTDQDPLRGGGGDIELTSEQSEEEKAVNGMSLFIVLGITTCFGVYRGVKAREK
jgi:hypothetical protein